MQILREFNFHIPVLTKKVKRCSLKQKKMHEQPTHLLTIVTSLTHPSTVRLGSHLTSIRIAATTSPASMVRMLPLPSWYQPQYKTTINAYPARVSSPATQSIFALATYWLISRLIILSLFGVTLPGFCPCDGTFSRPKSTWRRSDNCLN